MLDYQFASDALAPWWSRLKDQDKIELRTLPDFVRDILSHPDTPEVTAEAKDICWMLHCLMHYENRKWLSITQLALPYREMIGAKEASEAKLKSRVGMSILDGQERNAVAAGSVEQMQYRRRFLDFVSMCIPLEERKRYPFLLTLIDSHVMGTEKPPSNESTGVDAAAWSIANYLSAALQWERGKANQGFEISVDTPVDALEAHYQATLARLDVLIDEYPAMRVMATTPPSKDSLFSQLIVQAAVNRHHLETEAFQGRSNELIGMQTAVFTEIAEIAPWGLEEMLRKSFTGGQVNYLAFVKAALARTLAEKGKSMTAAVKATIDRQADAVIESARNGHFENEWGMNSFLGKHPRRAKALLWILLTWCYQHGFYIRNEDPAVKKPAVPVMTSKSKLFGESPDISTLRRMLATPAFSLQWDKPCPDRLAAYARQNAAIRQLVQRKLVERLKGATLAQWEVAAKQILPWDAYCSYVKSAELGTLMKDYREFESVALPLYRMYF